MGVRERRDRERQEMHQAILSAAQEIASREGWQALTIRRVAEKIEYSPPTVYEHFQSKEQIVIELMRGGFRQMLEDMRVARDAHSDPVEAMVGMGKAYWEFAVRRPEMHLGMHGETAFEACVGRAYTMGHKDPTGDRQATPSRHTPFEEVHERGELMELYRSRSPEMPENEPFPEAHEVFIVVRDALEKVIGSDHDLEDLSWKVVTIWGSLHGLISLAMAGLVPNGRVEGARLVEKLLRDLLRAWSAERKSAAH